MLTLDINEPWFGAKGGGEMITLKEQENVHPRFLRSFFFVLYDERFGSAGKAFCKVNGLLMDGPVIGHQGGMEARLLLLFDKQYKSDPGLKNMNLPTAYWASEHVPVTCKALSKMPMLAWGRRVYPHCAVTVCEWYSGSFNRSLIRKFMYTDEMQLRVLLFEIIYTLSELQRRYKFQHNDLHKDNVLLQRAEADTVFPESIVKLKKGTGKRKETFHYRIPERTIRPILWDFGMSVLHAAKDKVSIPDECGPHDNVGPYWCVPKTYEPSYDIHGLFMNILDCLPVESETAVFIRSLYPDEVIYEATDDEIQHMDENDGENDMDHSDNEEGDEKESNAEQEHDTSVSGDEEAEEEDEEEEGQAVVLPTKGLDDEEYAFKQILLHLSSHELITKLPNLKSALADVLGLDNVLATDEKTYEANMKELYGDICDSTLYKDLCYGPDATFMDYWFYLYPKADRKQCIEIAAENNFQFAPPNETGMLASYKLCEKAWNTFRLPTPHDILLHPYFDILRVEDNEALDEKN